MAVKESQFISPGTAEDPYLRSGGGGIFIHSESQNEKKKQRIWKETITKINRVPFPGVKKNN